MRISDWSSDVCSSDLPFLFGKVARRQIVGRNLDILRCQILARRIRTLVRIAGEEQTVDRCGQEETADTEQKHPLALFDAFVDRQARAFGNLRRYGGRTARRTAIQA